jgi:hypothetical protein
LSGLRQPRLQRLLGRHRPPRLLVRFTREASRAWQSPGPLRLHWAASRSPTHLAAQTFSPQGPLQHWGPKPWMPQPTRVPLLTRDSAGFHSSVACAMRCHAAQGRLKRPQGAVPKAACSPQREAWQKPGSMLLKPRFTEKGTSHLDSLAGLAGPHRPSRRAIARPGALELSALLQETTSLGRPAETWSPTPPQALQAGAHPPSLYLTSTLLSYITTPGSAPLQGRVLTVRGSPGQGDSFAQKWLCSAETQHFRDQGQGT